MSLKLSRKCLLRIIIDPMVLLLRKMIVLVMKGPTIKGNFLLITGLRSVRLNSNSKKRRTTSRISCRINSTKRMTNLIMATFKINTPEQVPEVWTR
jgi:hypothetical protein